MVAEVIQFIVGLYCLFKFFQWLDTQPKSEHPQDYMG